MTNAATPTTAERVAAMPDEVLHEQLEAGQIDPFTDGYSPITTDPNEVEYAKALATEYRNRLVRSAGNALNLYEVSFDEIASDGVLIQFAGGPEGTFHEEAALALADDGMVYATRGDGESECYPLDHDFDPTAPVDFLMGPITTTAEELADRIIEEIEAEEAKTSLIYKATDFSALHDECDANEFILAAVATIPDLAPRSMNSWIPLSNEATDLVSRHLGRRLPFTLHLDRAMIRDLRQAVDTFAEANPDSTSARRLDLSVALIYRMANPDAPAEHGDPSDGSDYVLMDEDAGTFYIEWMQTHGGPLEGDLHEAYRFSPEECENGTAEIDGMFDAEGDFGYRWITVAEASRL